MYTTQELLKKLEELENELGRFPNANDLKRFPEAPTAYTYYLRFGNSWAIVQSLYEEWKQVECEWENVDYETWKKNTDRKNIPDKIPNTPQSNGSRNSLAAKICDGPLC